MRYIIRNIVSTVLVLLVFSSCSSSKKGNIKNKSKETPDSVNISSKYKYEKLDVSKLYLSVNSDVLKEIDLSKVKNIDKSVLYSIDQGTYIKKSPLEIYELLSKKAKKRTIKDNILYLQTSLELNKYKDIDNILDILKKSDFIYSDIKEIDDILSRFNLFNKEISFLENRIDLLLEKKSSMNDVSVNQFLKILSIINNIDDLNLLKPKLEKYFEKYFKIDKYNLKVNKRFVDNLLASKEYSRAENFINKILKDIKNNKEIKYNKSELLNSLVSIYSLNNNLSKIKKLYLANMTLPENKDLFKQYISYLKKEKIWAKELKNIITNFNKNKSIDNFYRYYFAFQYENRNIKTLLNDYYDYLIKNSDDRAVKELSELLILNGKYKQAYQLLNIALINSKTSKYYDDYIITMGKIISHLPYNEKLYNSYYFFSTPDFIGGVLSLVQNQYKNNDFLATLDSQNNINERVKDMEFLFDKMKEKFKSNEKFIIFVKNYLSFLTRYDKKDRLKEVISLLKKLNKDIYFNLFLSKYIASKSKSDELNKNVYDLYLKILENNKNNKDKFSKYLSETLGYLHYFNLEKSILMVKELIYKYPNNEKLYEKLLYLLDSFRAYNKKIEVYETALKKFDKKTWSNKYSRFLIRKKMNDKMISLNKKLIKMLNSEEYNTYLTTVFSSKKYDKFNSKFNQLYEEVYIDALNKYPFNRVMIDKLLDFYNSFRYSYRYKSNDAISKYAKLLYKYICIIDKYRDSYFRDRLIKKSMNHEKIIKDISVKIKKTIPDLKYLAYMHEFRGEYEDSVKYYSILSRYYITDKQIIFKTAKLYKSLASSFYIEDPKFLIKAEILYQRLSFLYRNNSKYYISLSELYYELMFKEKAQKTLFRALEYEKGNEQKYIDIANMFYDYYDYDNALKIIYSYRERKNNKDLLIPFVGRLFELKKNEKLAINEYFRDLFNKDNDSYQSEKRLKSLYNKKQLKDLIVLKIEENIFNIIKNEKLFDKFRNFFISISNNDLISKLDTSLFENSKDISLLKKLYYIFKANKDKRAEKLLKKLESLETSDDIYNMLISFYKENKNINEVHDYYVKLILINPYENDKYSFLNLTENLISYLIKNKRYEQAIGKYNDLLTYIKDKEKRLLYELKIARVYKLISTKKHLKYLLKLDLAYPIEKGVNDELLSYYRDSNKINKMVNYLSKLIKRIKSNNKLEFSEKKYRIASYRGLLIQELISLKKYNSVLDQYIEILNRNPLDRSMINKVYNFAKMNKVENRLFNYYKKLSVKSFKNYKYLLLNAQLHILKEDNNNALEYYYKALKIEPQKLLIKLDIARTLTLLKKYKEAYKIYEKLYSDEKDSYYKVNYLKKMFKVSILMKDIELIAELAYRVAGKIDALKYDTSNVLFVAKLLYEYEYLDLSRKYYDKLILNSIGDKSYLNKDLYYQYCKTFINKGDGLALMKRVFELNDKLQYLDKTRYRYVLNSNKKTLFSAISRYIPDNISYFNKSEINLMNKYLEGVDSKYKSNISQYYKKINLIESYFNTLTGKYVKKTKYAYYKSILSFKKILKDGLYKSYKYNGLENTTLNKYKKAFISYTWDNKNSALINLESAIFDKCTTYNRNVDAVDTYIDYIRKQNVNKYKKLVYNKCLYDRIITKFIEYKEKSLAIQLINNQDKSNLWKIEEKTKLYWRLEEFSKEGIELYNQLLGLNLTIENELKDSKDTLNEKNWNNTVKEYSEYVLKSKISDIKLSDYINNIIETSPKSIKAYLTVADIYFNNKNYNKSIEYLLYAKKLKNKSIIKIKLIDSYLNLQDNINFNKLKNEILKSSNLNDFYKLYVILEKHKKLDNHFISAYNNLLLKNYESYGYYKLRNFITQVSSYYETKDIAQLILFVENFKDGRAEIYKSLLFNLDMEFSNDYKVKLFKQILNYYIELDDKYSQRTWILATTEFLLKTKKYEESMSFLSKYKPLFSYEDKFKYDFYEFKIVYYMKDINSSKELLKNSLKYDNYDYSVNFYLDFILEDKVFSKKLLLEVFSLMKENDRLNFDSLLKLLGVLDDKRLRVEILNIINNKSLSTYDLDRLEKFCTEKGFNDIYNLILENKYNTHYINFAYVRFNEYDGDYYLYLLNLIKLNKQGKLKEALAKRKLSISELKSISDKIGEYSNIQKEKILKNLTLNIQDILYIKALVNFSLKNYKKSLNILNKIDLSKDYKYNFILLPLKVKNLAKLNKITDGEIIKSAIKLNPKNKDLKFILFEYYLNVKDDEKAFYVLAEMGLSAYLSFDTITKIDFGYLNFYSRENYESYYDTYKPETLAENALSGGDETEYLTVQNFINDFSKERKVRVLEFLYKQYKKFSKSRTLGLAILYAYKEIDKKYENEYKKLVKEER